jgi:SAM-dependent methyltransferase
VKDDRRARLLANLVCPECRGELARNATRLRCGACGVEAEIGGRAVVFLDGRPSEAEAVASSDPLLRTKERLKTAFPRLYSWLIGAISPVYSSGVCQPLLGEVDPATDFVLDFGSGTHRFHSDIINVDLAPYREVDLVTSGGSLPLRDGCADAILSIAVLEHVANPQRTVADLARVLKPGGRVQVFVPFMQGIHAAPDDYQRWTPHGLEVLFGAFTDLHVTVAGGPTSALVWILQEWLAITLSFGSKTLYWVIYVLAFALTPIKFLDAALQRHPMAAKIASGFVLTARKPGAT